jgi:hypothetical protein
MIPNETEFFFLGLPRLAPSLNPPESYTDSSSPLFHSVFVPSCTLPFPFLHTTPSPHAGPASASTQSLERQNTCLILDQLSVEFCDMRCNSFPSFFFFFENTISIIPFLVHCENGFNAVSERLRLINSKGGCCILLKEGRTYLSMEL